MKLTKKIACAVLAAAMSLTSVAALAVTPDPKDNAQGFVLTERYYEDGLFYEAKEILNKIAPNAAQQTYDAQKWNVWNAKVDAAIEDWEISVIFDAVEKAYAANDILLARAALAQLGAWNVDYCDSIKAMAWEVKLAKITTPAQAIVCVEKATGTYLDEPTLYYSVEKFGDGWDVYVKFDDSKRNLYAWHVNATTGAVTVDNADWPGNYPDSINIK